MARKNLVTVGVEIEESVWNTTWRIVKRFLRAFVPQIPAVLAWAGDLFTPQQVPYLVFGGAILTALDKLFRDKGLYDSVARTVTFRK